MPSPLRSKVLAEGRGPKYVGPRTHVASAPVPSNFPASHTGCLTHRQRCRPGSSLRPNRRHVVDVHERVVGDDEVEGTGAKEQPRPVGQQVARCRVGLDGEPCQRRRRPRWGCSRERTRPQLAVVGDRVATPLAPAADPRPFHAPLERTGTQDVSKDEAATGENGFKEASLRKHLVRTGWISALMAGWLFWAGPGVAAAPKAYVGLFKDDAVAVIDTAQNKVTGTISVPKGPHGLGVTPDGRKVYVSSDGASTVSVIDTGSDRVIASIEVGATPHGLAISGTGGGS